MIRPQSYFSSALLAIGVCSLVLGQIPWKTYSSGQPAVQPEAAKNDQQPRGELATFLKAKGYVDIPLKIIKGGHMDVDVKVNGETLRFILDTGSGATVIDAAVAKRLGLVATKTDKTLAGVSGAHPLEKTLIEQLSVGPVQSREETVVADLSSVNAERKKDGDPACDGLLGATLLQLFCAVIDYPSAKLFLMAPAAAAALIYVGPNARGVMGITTTVNRSFGGGRFTYGVIVSFAEDQPVALTKAAFERLETGMTYGQMAEILGGELSKGRLQNTYTGTLAVVQGKRRIDLTFQDGKVTVKASKELE
jgi:hypothetical protein